MNGDKSKEGVSVREIEAFAKKYRFEVFFIAVFVLACLFTFFLWGLTWSIISTAVGAVLGTLFSGKVAHFSKMAFQFVFKHEKAVQIILGIVVLILAIFIPPLIFLVIGLHAGKDLIHWAMEIYSQSNPQ